ncbi:MAG: hypothetical protein QOG83_1775 [Alphaproteobacteria bacterium]|jgi:membrane protein implicated in regulation of membrane protease activity|nr:hypothetical protein [Alphaproteobacteria bacterium]
MVHAHDAHHGSPLLLRPFAIALLLPLIVVLTVAILLGLLGIFVAWLTVVAVLITAVVASDLARRTMRHWARPPAPLKRQAAGFPGR